MALDNIPLDKRNELGSVISASHRIANPPEEMERRIIYIYCFDGQQRELVWVITAYNIVENAELSAP
jgi:hypothetical protein